MGEWIQKTIWRVQAIFGNKDAAIHLESLNSVNSQATEEDRDIWHRVEDQPDFQHAGLIGVLDSIGDSTRGIFSGIGKAIKDVFNIAEFTVKNIIKIAVVALVLVALYYFLVLRKAVE